MKLISSEDKRSLINLLVLHGPLFYLSTAAALGVSNAEEESAGPLYKVYLALLFLLGTYPVLKMFLKNCCSSKVVPPLFILFIYILFAFFHFSFDENNFFLQLVCFAIPAVCVALSIDKKEGLIGMMKWFDLFLPFLAFTFVFLIKNLMLIKLKGDAAYGQNTSYFAAYCFIINIFLIRYKDYYSRFNILNKKWYGVVRLLLLPYFFIICIFAGGRGAAILLFIGIIYNLDLVRKIPAKYIWKTVFILLAILVITAFAVGKIAEDYYEILSNNFDRVSALFEGGTIDTSASSGRDDIWTDAINVWMSSPVWGYGLFSYLNNFYIRPHNIFLEILLQGGLLLLMVFLIILNRLFIKYRKILKTDRRQIFLIPFILYSSTQLMFSGSYWMETFFWFILTYIYAYNSKRIVIKKMKN